MRASLASSGIIVMCPAVMPRSSPVMFYSLTEEVQKGDKTGTSSGRTFSVWEGERENRNPCRQEKQRGVSDFELQLTPANPVGLKTAELRTVRDTVHFRPLFSDVAARRAHKRRRSTPNAPNSGVIESVEVHA